MRNSRSAPKRILCSISLPAAILEFTSALQSGSRFPQPSSFLFSSPNPWRCICVKLNVAQHFSRCILLHVGLTPTAWCTPGFLVWRRALLCIFMMGFLLQRAVAQTPTLPCSFSLDLSGVQPEDAHITTLRFYVSSPRLFHKGVQVDGFTLSYRLVNALDSLTNRFGFPRTNALPFDEVRLFVGVDSTTTASGIMPGDLDPVYNMYWTWQSGYINIKLEGSRKGQEMTLHLGGYSAPNNSLQELRVSAADAQRLNFVWHAQSFFSQLPPDSPYRVMRPCSEANRMARLFTSSFSLDH